MSQPFDNKFYHGKSWGTIAIRDAWDLPTLKLRYLMEVLDRRPVRDASLLEVGCGSGRILRSIRERDGELKLTGIDLSTEQIELARLAAAEARIEFRQGDGERLPFEDGSFDFVCFLDYLEHVQRPQASLREISRVLKPGGVLHLVCPAEGQPGTIYWFSKLLFRRHFKAQTLGHIQQFSIREIEDMVAAAGFALAERRYSYHLLGSAMDYALYTLLLDERIARVYWAHDKYHVSSDQRRGSPAGALLNATMTIGNAVAYFESAALRNSPLFAAAVHFTARKRP